VPQTPVLCPWGLQVTEEALANFFSECGPVQDCRICGDPNSAMRFAFLEFADVESAQRVGGSQHWAYIGSLRHSRLCVSLKYYNWPQHRLQRLSIYQVASAEQLQTLTTTFGRLHVQALAKSGTILGATPLRVLPSKTAIVPVSQDFMPRSADEVSSSDTPCVGAQLWPVTFDYSSGLQHDDKSAALVAPVATTVRCRASMKVQSKTAATLAGV
jgi:RNA recognition motif-containing protein